MWIGDSLVARLVFGFELERSCANLRDAGGRHNAARCATCCESCATILLRFNL